METAVTSSSDSHNYSSTNRYKVNFSSSIVLLGSSIHPCPTRFFLLANESCRCYVNVYVHCLIKERPDIVRRERNLEMMS
ncbi:hypothetical protein PMAYCL1PPCAC_21184 [Pristionchus mayeri]|uniref:Uncharacterized protein n=1 Tax=Pristionchus mayeri TaxID=1317129 RepID=A0AAN5CUU2_9BILA|nr:hypothetical protein PMAYCL1PPCAC_21184 [Pristionchus mayeri]